IEHAFREALKAKTGSDVPAGGHQLAAGGLWLLKLALDAAKTDELDKFRAAVLKMDLPVGSLMNGWGVKFDESGQNSNERVQHYMLQWQNGQLVSVWPSSSRATAPSGRRSARGTSVSSLVSQLVVSTILLGGLYALIAVGLT